MADAYRKISDFSKATAFNDTDLLLVSQNGTTKVVEGSKVKSYATDAGKEAAKITKAEINSDGDLVLTLADGTTSFNCGEVVGTSITGATINSSYHLILTLSNGKTLDAGYCRGASGSSTGGDMLKSTYDSTGVVSSAGGIASYIGQTESYSIFATFLPDIFAGGTRFYGRYYPILHRFVVSGGRTLTNPFTTGSFSSFTVEITSNKPAYLAHVTACARVKVDGVEIPCTAALIDADSDTATLTIQLANTITINGSTESVYVEFYLDYTTYA